MESEMISAQKSAIQLQRNSSPSSTSTFTACSWRRSQIAKMSSCLVSRRIQQRNSAIKIVMCLKKLQRNHALNLLELWMSVEKPRAVKVSSCNSSTVHRIPVKAKELRLSQGFKSKWPNHLLEEEQTRIEHLFLNLVSFLNFREPRYIATSEIYRVTQR